MNNVRLPEYTDGYMDIYSIATDDKASYPEEYLVDRQMRLWFRELSVYDRIRYELGQNGMEVTMKIRIPQYRNIDSRCVCVIAGVQHEVYNATHVYDKNGFPETEITFRKPDCRREVREVSANDKAGT